MSFDTSTIRQNFAVFRASDPPIYLDSAATAQVPEFVLDAMHAYNTQYRSNVHRGMHALAEQSTVAYEDARKTVQTFINAKSVAEIIFTKSCTEAINLVAKTWGRQNLSEGDVIALSILEHHSNIVPWQQLCEEKGCTIEWIEMDSEGNLKHDSISNHTKLIAIAGQSNVLGKKPDLSAIIERAHAMGTKVLVDAAQLIVHHQTDVQTLDCDFLTFSGHKLYGPTGIGVLYAKRDLLEQMPTFLGGGGMIQEVKKDGFTSAEIPQKFEAGTPPIAQAIGLEAAIKWISQFAWDDITEHEEELMRHTMHLLGSIEGLSILGNGERSSCLSFTIDNVHPHDLTDILGKKNIHLRAGHHCTQPLHDYFGIPASTRMSFGIYNEKGEIDQAVKAIQESRNLLA